MEQAAQVENMRGGADVQEKGQDGEKGKLFTQDEVNGLIQARIARAKEQAGKDAKAEYDRKLGELQARELKLVMKGLWR